MVWLRVRSLYELAAYILQVRVYIKSLLSSLASRRVFGMISKPPIGWLYMYTVKSHFKALGLCNFIRSFGWLISGWAYKRNKKHVSERRNKTYLRNELKLTYHYVLSYIYNTFIVRYNKRRIYFKNIYKTDLCDCLKRNAKGTHLYSRWAYKRGGGLISGIKYSLANGWAYIRGGGLKV